MRVSMPSGRAHGWGIAGDYLTREIAKLPPVAGVTLHCISGHDFRPMNPDDWDRHNIGYCFFENEIEAWRHSRRAAQEWDFIVAGSSWCEYQLRIGGVRQTATILQGVDPQLFHPAPPREDDGRFIVFSGGKFELRKGQDLVIAAMRAFMARHKDAWLCCSWQNQWPASIATMAGSKTIVFQPESEECPAIIRQTLADNGIPLERVIINPLLDNSRMREIYANTDVGLFPNRCEGGNNMVMCEYLACGRTAIASDTTGHADVITTANAFPLNCYEPQLVEMFGQPSAVWFEPSVEEIVTQLECVYWHRDELARRAATAARDMERLSWERAAKLFHHLATKLATTASFRR
jgi:glycosyltransferase involved in cell wall biosynthesis